MEERERGKEGKKGLTTISMNPASRKRGTHSWIFEAASCDSKAGSGEEMIRREKARKAPKERSAMACQLRH